jgi:outer membrane protein W
VEEIMKSKWITLGLAIGGVAIAGVAGAQEKDQNVAASKSDELAPAANALELTVGTGYAQGFGDIASNRPALTDVAQPGGAVQIGVGYRLIPQLTLGLYGSGAMFSRGDQVDTTSNLYSASAGVQADWHFIPSGSEFDPWVSLGTGWRGYWVRADQGTTSLQGLELAKLQLGVDYRVARAVAISPVIGADLSMFLSESNPGTSSYSNVADPRVNTFVFAGLQGRFDIPLGNESSSKVAAR